MYIRSRKFMLQILIFNTNFDDKAVVLIQIILNLIIDANNG